MVGICCLRPPSGAVPGVTAEGGAVTGLGVAFCCVGKGVMAEGKESILLVLLKKAAEEDSLAESAVTGNVGVEVCGTGGCSCSCF